MLRRKGYTGNITQKRANIDEKTTQLHNDQRCQTDDGLWYMSARAQSRWSSISRFYPKQLKIAATFCLLAWVCGCATVESHHEPGDPYAYDPKLGLEEEDILTNFNLHRGRWWNYYARGSWLLAWDHYCAALKDFEVALNKRGRDKRDARTYGMHFMDYFPHREYGIASCLEGEREMDLTEKKKLFREAMDELKISIEQEASSKAKFYLKRATAGFWSVSQADARPPVVWIENSAIDRWADVPTLYINGYATTLRIRASDDQSGIGTVWMNGERLLVESAEEDFNDLRVVTVDVHDKEKTVVVKAADLAGNKGWPATVKLVVDNTSPTAAIRVHSEETTLLEERIRVEISAVDNESLKSVRVGKDPYDNRDCRGRPTWDGVFFVEPGTRDLAVEITDQAGNVTTMSANLESERIVDDTGRGGPLFAVNTPLGRNQKLLKHTFDVTQEDSRNIFYHLARFSSLETHSLPHQLGPIIVLQQRVSYQERFPKPTFELPDFTDNLSIRTSRNTYPLSGYLRHANDLQWIKVKVNGKDIKKDELSEKEDGLWFFRASVPFKDHGPTLSIKLEALCKDGTRVPGPDLKVTKEEHCLWVPQSKYSVTLLPLKQDYAVTDPFMKHIDREAAHNVVLSAVLNFKECDPIDNESRRRFDCHDLITWNEAKFKNVLKFMGAKQTMEPYKHGRIASDFANKRGTDLAIYGSIEKGPDRFDMRLRFTGVESFGKPLFDEVIDLYDERTHPDDPNFPIRALMTKLERSMRRIRGKVVESRRNQTIVISCGTKDHVFDNLDLLLYNEFGSGLDATCEVKCWASVTKRRQDNSDAEVERCDWGDAMGNLREMRIIGK